MDIYNSSRTANCSIDIGDVVELVYAWDLKSPDFGHEGSTPSIATNLI